MAIKEYQDIDLSNIPNKITNVELFAKNSGIVYINEYLRKEFAEISDTYFFEYSIISSLLDPRHNKLYCFAAINDTSIKTPFKNTIEKYAHNLIKKLYINGNTNWFHNSELFVAPSNIEEFLTNERSKCDSNIINSIEKSEEKYIEHKKKSFYVNNMTYPRLFQDILKYSKYIKENTKGDLIDNYHTGAICLKSYYDELMIINNVISPEQKTYYLTFPLISSPSVKLLPDIYENSFGKGYVKNQGQGHFFLYFIPKDNIDYDKIILRCNKVFNDVNDLIRLFSLNYVFNTGLRLLELARHESIKSAKSAIMSRNMSHNLGSHVMFYIKQKLQSVNRIKAEGVLAELYSPGSQITTDEIKKILRTVGGSEVELPFLVGLGRFINYLQERQDYIATISTDYIPAKSTINFKDFIYDELKPDLRYKRHNDVKGVKPRNLLLDFIAYSEGYVDSDSIVINFGDFNGVISNKDATIEETEKKIEKLRNEITETKFPEELQLKLENLEVLLKELKSFRELRKFDISLPGGVIGRQAIFSIMENIIRNSAKHSGRRQDGKLALKFEKVDLETINWTKEDVKFTPCNGDNSRIIEGEELAKLYNDVADKYFVLKITSDMPNSKDSIEKLIKKLADPYVDNQGMMNDSSKGLKEMRISAAWLRGYSIDLHIPDTEPPVISIGKKPYDNSTTECTIEYYICLPKPKRVAFVVDKNTVALSDDEKKELDDQKKELMVQGSCIFEITDEDCKKDKIASFSKDIADYAMVVLCTESANKTIPYLSFRHIAYSKNNLAMMINFIDTATKKIDPQDQKSTEEIEAERKDRCIEPIYKLWFDATFASEKGDAKLSILDAKAEKAKGAEGNKDVLLSTTSESSDDFYKSKIIFSTHYTGLKGEIAKEKEANKAKNEKEVTYVAEKYINAKFVESITGNNSTDRLIRQDEWNAEWKYKHLAAGLLRIAIFDERIFSSIMPHTKKSMADIESVISGFMDVVKSNSRKEINKYIDDVLKDQYCIDSIDDRRDIRKKIILDESGSVKFREIMTDLNNQKEYNIENAQLFHEKRTWFYDIRCYEKEKRVDIIGYNAPIETTIGNFSEIDRNVCVLGSLKEDDANGYVIAFEANIDIRNKFDIISIHQGILDKIYSTFNIKEKKDEKYKITKVIHDVFSRFCNIESGTKAYLHNLIIHSGRSKPNEEDMPQHQPFVQFAAIDHAVRDCKFTLSELLLTAHYEKNNSNNS